MFQYTNGVGDAPFPNIIPFTLLSTIIGAKDTPYQYWYWHDMWTAHNVIHTNENWEYPIIDARTLMSFYFYFFMRPLVMGVFLVSLTINLLVCF